MPYRILIGDLAEVDMRSIRIYDLRAIMDSIDQFLTTSPSTPTSRRMVELEQPAVSEFRLRVGEYRVYYNVVEAEQAVVLVRIVKKGTKATSEVTQNASD